MRSSVSQRLPRHSSAVAAGGSHRPKAATLTIPLRFLHATGKLKQATAHRQQSSTSFVTTSHLSSSLHPHALLSAGHTALHNQQLDTVVQIFRTLQKHPEAAPTISAYNLLLGCSAAVGDADSAIQLVRRVCLPVSEGGKAVAADADTLLHLFTALVRDQRSEDVLQLLSDLDSASKPMQYTKSRHPTAISTSLLGTLLIQPTTLASTPSLELLLRITRMFANRGQYDYGRQTFTLIYNRFKSEELQLHAHTVLELATTLMRLAVGGVSADKQKTTGAFTNDHVLSYWRSTRTLIAQLLHSSTTYHISNTQLLHTYSSAVRALCRVGNLEEAHAAYRECIQYIQLTTAAASGDSKQRQKLDALLRQPESARKLQSPSGTSVDVGSAFEKLFVNNPEVPSATAVANSSRSSNSSTTFLRRLVRSQAAKAVATAAASEEASVTLPAGAKRPVNRMLRSMIKACSLMGRSQLAERVFQDFQRVGATPTSADYEQLLLSYAPWRQVMQRPRSSADELVEKPSEPQDMQQTVHSWFVYHHRARTLYKEMLQAGVQPTPAFLQTLTSANASNFTYTTPSSAADAMSASNHLQLRYSITDSVNRLLRQITARGYTPDQVMLQSLVASYLRVSAPWHALYACTQFLSSWHVQPTSDILTVLAATGEKLPAGETRVNFHLQYQDFVRGAGLEHLENGQTYLHWLRALTGSDSTNDTIQQILGQAMDQRVATIDHFHVIARSALKAPALWSSWRFVIRLFYGVVSANPHTVLTTGVKPHAQALMPTAATYEMLLRTAASLAYAGDAMNLYSHMQRQSHIAPTASTIASVLQAAVLAQPQLPEHTLKAQLRSLLRDMQSQRLSVDEVMACVQETDAKKQAIRETLLQATKDDSKLHVTAQAKPAIEQRQAADDELTDSDLVLT